MPMPPDIDPQSGFRLPLPKREDLDDAGKRALAVESVAGTPCLLDHPLSRMMTG